MQRLLTITPRRPREGQDWGREREERFTSKCAGHTEGREGHESQNAPERGRRGTEEGEISTQVRGGFQDAYWVSLLKTLQSFPRPTG